MIGDFQVTRFFNWCSTTTASPQSVDRRERLCQPRSAVAQMMISTSRSNHPDPVRAPAIDHLRPLETYRCWRWFRNGKPGRKDRHFPARRRTGRVPMSASKAGRTHCVEGMKWQNGAGLKICHPVPTSAEQQPRSHCQCHHICAKAEANHVCPRSGAAGDIGPNEPYGQMPLISPPAKRVST